MTDYHWVYRSTSVPLSSLSEQKNVSSEWCRRIVRSCASSCVWKDEPVEGHDEEVYRWRWRMMKMVTAYRSGG